MWPLCPHRSVMIERTIIYSIENRNKISTEIDCDQIQRIEEKNYILPLR